MSRFPTEKPLPTNGIENNVDMLAARASYWDFIMHRSKQTPSVECLLDYLETANKSRPQHEATITSVQYEDGSSPNTRNFEEADLRAILTDPAQPAGRILIVQDINARLIELLGELLDVDPLFYAGHVETEFQDIDTKPQAPAYGMSPARLAETGFLHLHYQQVLKTTASGDDSESAYLLKSTGNVSRNIRRLPRLVKGSS